MKPDGPPAQKPADPLQSLVTSLERVNAELEQIPLAATPATGPNAAKAQQPTYGYNPPAAPRERPAQKAKRSGLLLAIGVGAAAMPLIVALAIIVPRFLPERSHEDASDESVPLAAQDDSATEVVEQPNAPVKPKNRRVLLTRPVTAKPPSPGPADKRAAPKPAVGDGGAGKAAPSAAPQGVAANTPQQGGVAAPPAASPPSPASDAGPSTPFEPSFEGLPKAVDLPALTEVNKPVSLGKLEVPPTARCQIALVHGIQEETTSYQFRTAVNADEPRLWRISMAEKVSPALEQVSQTKPPTEIAQLRLQSGQVFFQWLPDRTTVPADSLRNALIWVEVEGKRHRLQLRKAGTPAPLLLDLEKTPQEVSFGADALPPSQSLQLEFVEATPGIVATHARRVRGDETLRLIVQHGPPAVEVRLRLAVGEGEASVRVEPCLVDPSGDVMPLTITDLESMEKELPLEVRRTERELAQVREDRKSLQTRIARLPATGKTNPQLASLRTSLGKLDDKERLLAERVGVLQRRAAALPNLIQVGEQIHQKTQLRFRVFFVSGGEEVTLLGM